MLDGFEICLTVVSAASGIVRRTLSSDGGLPRFEKYLFGRDGWFDCFGLVPPKTIDVILEALARACFLAFLGLVRFLVRGELFLLFLGTVELVFLPDVFNLVRFEDFRGEVTFLVAPLLFFFLEDFFFLALCLVFVFSSLL